MEAHTLNCLMCGAPTASDAPNCGHCGARLATVACPNCFGMIFQGSRFCAHCGSRALRAVMEPDLLECPKCKDPMGRVQVGEEELVECAKCHGLWVEKDRFEHICQSREKQSAVLGLPTLSDAPPPGQEMKVRYVKCPVCKTLMHRVNFARSSGVVLDMCKKHGTWFDRDELKHIVAFIQGGGMDKVREKEMEELESARRRLQATTSALFTDQRRIGSVVPRTFDLDLISMAGTVLRIFMR